jgi:hypothetical protein
VRNADLMPPKGTKVWLVIEPRGQGRRPRHQARRRGQRRRHARSRPGAPG